MARTASAWHLNLSNSGVRLACKTYSAGLVSVGRAKWADVNPTWKCAHCETALKKIRAAKAADKAAVAEILAETGAA
jgi:hypothetical protein